MKRKLILISLILLLDIGVVISSSAQNYTSNSYFSQPEELLDYAKKLIGIKYKKGGTSTKGFDCSGFVRYVFQKCDLKIPHSSAAISKIGEWINLESVIPGDLIFFKNGSKNISHIGIVSKVESKMIYFIHSSNSKGVCVSKLNESYWNKKFAGVKRIL